MAPLPWVGGYNMIGHPESSGAIRARAPRGNEPTHQRELPNKANFANNPWGINGLQQVPVLWDHPAWQGPTDRSTGLQGTFSNGQAAPRNSNSATTIAGRGNHRATGLPNKPNSSQPASIQALTSEFGACVARTWCLSRVRVRGLRLATRDRKAPAAGPLTGGAGLPRHIGVRLSESLGDRSSSDDRSGMGWGPAVRPADDLLLHRPTPKPTPVPQQRHNTPNPKESITCLLSDPERLDFVA